MDKIICLGKNYAEHAEEMKEALPEKPVIFIKPPSVLREAQHNGDTLTLHLPPGDELVHHECEVVLRLDKGGYRLSPEEAKTAIGAVSLGLDLTLRNIQATLKKKGHPWTVSKVFPDSAVVGPWKRMQLFPDLLEAPFSMSIHGKTRQQSSASQMILKPIDCIVYASQFFRLEAGDLLFTGTPAGVGPVKAADIALLKWSDLSYSVKWISFPG